MGLRNWIFGDECHISYRNPAKMPEENIDPVLTVGDMIRLNVRDQRRPVDEIGVLVAENTHEVYMNAETPLDPESRISVVYTTDDEERDELILFIPRDMIFYATFSDDSLGFLKPYPITRVVYTTPRG